MGKLYAAILGLICVLAGGTAVQAADLSPEVHGFIPNKGQWPAEVLYLQKTSNMRVWITRTGMVIDQFKIEDMKRTGHVLRLTWQGADQLSTNALSEQVTTGTVVNVFRGNNHSQFTTGLQVKRSLRFEDLYPGIDLIYYLDEQDRLRYDLDVQPHVNIDHVGFTVEGDMGVTIDTDAVYLKTTMGQVNMGDLYAYVLGRKSLETKAIFTAKSGGISFSVPQWNGEVPLRVDPVVYGTYVGGEGDDAVKAVCYHDGSVYVGGWTATIDFPTQVGAYSTEVDGLFDSFIAKLDPELSEVEVFTYYGGMGSDLLTGMVVGENGDVAFTGTTNSPDIPIAAGAVGQLYKNELDVYVAKFAPGLNELKASTYLGGNKDDIPHAIAMGDDGSMYVVGGTNSNEAFPATLAHQFENGGQIDCFAARLTTNAGGFIFCTYFGKSGNEEMTAIALDNSGNFLVTGYTSSSDFEYSPSSRWRWFRNFGDRPYDRTYNGGNTDAFVLKMYADGTLSKRRDENTFSTFFGGSGEEMGTGVYVDDIGRPVVVGITNSPELETVGGQQTSVAGNNDIFMAVLSDDGRGLVVCSYYGGTGNDEPLGMIPSPDFNKGLVFGKTNSVDFPVTGSGSSGQRVGKNNAFFALMNPFNTEYATLLPGAGEDAMVAAGFDANSDIYFAFETTSPNLLVRDNAWIDGPVGETDGYVGKFAFGDVSLSTPNGGERWCIGSQRSIAWSTLDMHDEETYRVEISADGGETWSAVIESTTRRNQNWIVPDTLEPGNQYMMRVKTSRGHVSTSGMFTVSDPPVVNSISESITACEGQPIELVVEASGTNIEVQWQFNGRDIEGANGDTLLIESLGPQTSGEYSVVVTGACTPEAKSSLVQVLIAPATAIEEQPQGITVDQGKPFTLSVTAVGGDLKYQWKRAGYDIDGATAATYTVPTSQLADAGMYSCSIVGTCGDVTSEEVEVVVTPTTSVDEEDAQTVLAIEVLGPIPADDVIRLRIDGQFTSTVTATIFAINGDQVGTLDLGSLTRGAVVEIPASELPSGIYAVQLNDGTETLRTTVHVVH